MYYIVQSVSNDGQKEWDAHTGIRARFGSFDVLNYVGGTYTLISADECERKLRVVLASMEIRPQVVRVVEV